MSRRTLISRWWRAWTGVCLIITGTPVLVACYGPPVIPPEPADLTVELVDFTYQPASPIVPGTALVFQLQANKPTTAGVARVLIGTWDMESGQPPPYWHTVMLNDRGRDLDAVAQDGTWTGTLEWREDYGTQDSLPVIAQLVWDDGTPPLELNGLPLSVEEPRED